MKGDKTELLAPAGSLEALKAVAQAGADAVYAGGEKFGARAYAKNFTEDELMEGLDYLHIRGKRLYLTVNTLLKEREMEGLGAYLTPLYEAGLDAVIVQDMGVLHFVKRHFKGLAIHASTQMGITGAYGARMMLEAGCHRIVAARELSLEEIADIYQKTGAQIECFVHGSLCYCYSGQCLMSSMIGGRSGNRGRCAQPCRLPYRVDGSREERYYLSPKDLCGISKIPELIRAGAYSFKIEGRMKQAGYAAGVTRIYRKYIDRYEESQKGNDKEDREGRAGYLVSREDHKRLLDLGNRSGFTEGYFAQQNGKGMMALTSPSHKNGKGKETAGKERLDGEKEKIKGILRLSCGCPAALMLEYKELHIEVLGEVVQPSRKQPLSELTVLEKMKKTGDTPFVFSELKVEMEEGVFLAVGALNQLRRKGLGLLQERILHPYRRKLPAGGGKPQEGVPAGEGGDGPCRESLGQAGAQPGLESQDTPRCRQKSPSAGSPPQLRVLTETLVQYQFALRQPEVGRIYIEGAALYGEGQKGRHTGFGKQLSHCAAQAKEAGKECYLALPYVFRKKTAEWYGEHWQEVSGAGLDGFLARNYEELQFLKEKGIGPSAVQGDYQLYAYSNEALRGMRSLPLEQFTLPVELNFKELCRLDSTKGEAALYGYQPLMVSAQCIHKNTVSCDRKEGISYLEDRLGNVFPVRNQCRDCYNVVYNTSPLSLLHHYQDICRLQPAGARLSFTIEGDGEMEQVFGWYRKAILGGIRQEQYGRGFTNGHWKRGVE